MFSRRAFLQTASTLLGAAAVPSFSNLAAAATEQTYPSRSVRFLVANSPGSAPDILARQVGQQLTPLWKQSVVVENKGAAGGVSAIDTLTKSEPDGLTLLVAGDGAITIMPHLQKKLPYDVRTDAIPVIKLGQVEFVLVTNPRLGVKNLKEFVDYAKSHVGKLNYASAGTGSSLHLTMELLKEQAGFEATHVPYKGGPLGLQDVLGGQVDAMFVALAPALPHIKAGKLVPIAVSSKARSQLLPDVPAVAETYKGYESVTWFGLFAPKGTPDALVDKIARDSTQVLAQPQVQESLAQLGIKVTGESRQDFARQVSSDYTRYAQLVQHIGLTL